MGSAVTITTVTVWSLVPSPESPVARHGIEKGLLQGRGQQTMACEPDPARALCKHEHEAAAAHSPTHPVHASKEAG